MIKPLTRTHCSNYAALLRQIFQLALCSLLPLSAIYAQTSSTDSMTPSGLAPGNPTGSYPLSGFENVNLYNGNLNFHLPLVKIGGRGKAGYTMMLAIDHQTWSVSVSSDHVAWADPYFWSGYKPGLSAGAMNVRTVSTDPQLCESTNNYWYTRSLTRLTFTAADGTEYEFRDALTNGAQLNNHSCYNLSTARRGKVWKSNEGAATFIADQEIYDNPYGANETVLDSNGAAMIYISGYLLMKDGTRYRIDNNGVSWIRDANGNKVNVAGNTLTDSLNRPVVISTDGSGNTIITTKGFGGVSRQIKIWRASLSQLIRSDLRDMSLYPTPLIRTKA